MFVGLLFGATKLTFFPLIKTSPFSGFSKPAIILKSVVLPHPDGPNSEKNSPSFIPRHTLLTALILPEIILGVCLLTVLIQLGLDLNLWSVVLGHTLLITPFSTLIMVSAFNNLDISLEEASLDLGMSSLQTFWLIILPMVSPGLISSLLIGFVISLDEFIIAFFLTGVEPTLPVYIWSQFRFPAKLPSTMALGTILLVVSLILVSLFEYFRRRMELYNNYGVELDQK